MFFLQLHMYFGNWYTGTVKPVRSNHLGVGLKWYMRLAIQYIFQYAFHNDDDDDDDDGDDDSGDNDEIIIIIIIMA